MVRCWLRLLRTILLLATCGIELKAPFGIAMDDENALWPMPAALFATNLDPQIRSGVMYYGEDGVQSAFSRDHVLCAVCDVRANAGPDDDEGDGELGVATRIRTRPKKPSQYKVLLLNDDYTPMEFVVMVLQRFFGMNLEEATRVMLHVHQRGVGVCGVFTYEVAETKVNQVMDCARENQHPLQCTLEKA